MANPLKVLTQLTASREAQFAEVVEMQKTVTISGAEADLIVSGGGEISGSAELKIAGAASLGSSLDVKGASALSGTLGVVGAADLQSTLDVSGVAVFASDVSASAGMDVVGAVHVGGAFDMDSTLNVDGAASFQSSISGAATLDIGGAAHIAGAAQLDSTLDVDGAVDFDSTLNVAGVATFQSAISGAAGLDIDGNADISGSLAVHSNAVIYGNLEVKGTTTTIESTTLSVADKNVEIAKVASPTDTTADGAGITILGASNKTFQWNNDGHGFTSSENMNLAEGKVYKINGQELLAKVDNKAKLSYNGGTASISVSNAAVDMAGDLVLSDDLHVSGNMEVDGTSQFDGVATFASDVTASANVDVSGSVNVGAGAAYKMSGVEVISDQDNHVLIQPSDASNAKIKLYKGVGTLDLGTGDDAVTINAQGTLWVRSVADTENEFISSVPSILESTLSVSGVASFTSDITASAGMDLGGALHVVGAADFDSTLNVDGQADFQDASNFHANVGMDAALELSGSTFVNIATPIVNDKYNVNDAIRALDALVGNQGSNINNAYNGLRYLSSKNFDAQGMASFTSSFAAADIEQVSVDVLVQAGGSGPWTNDLLSVQVKAAGSFVGFEISAPAMAASDKVRIIAVKESGSLA